LLVLWGVGYTMSKINEQIVDLIDNLLYIGINLSAEKDHDALLEKILSGARKITRADAGTLYLAEDNKLEFKILQNDTIGYDHNRSKKEIDLPPVKINKKSAAGYCASTEEVLAIDDVYNSEKFDFLGPRRYDSMTGYRTRSMLLAPMLDQKNELLGVIQLINATNQEDEVIPFSNYHKKVLAALASQAAISINNLQYIQETANLFRGMVESLAAMVDSRNPFTANHTRRVAQMTEIFIEVLNENSLGPLKEINFSDDDRLQLLMAAWLHDIGKLAVPLDIMQKTNRLGRHYDTVIQRFDLLEEVLINRKEQPDLTAGGLAEEWDKKLALLREGRQLIKEVNGMKSLPVKNIKDKLKKLYQEKFKLVNQNKEISLLTKPELEALLAEEGFLTAGEQERLESHVLEAQKILRNIPFSREVKRVPQIVRLHHEFLDGSGYPEGLTGKEIPLEARIITIIDRFDSLVARPLEKPKSKAEAIETLREMAAVGKLDKNLVDLFCRHQIWQSIDFTGECTYKFVYN